MIRPIRKLCRGGENFIPLVLFLSLFIYSGQAFAVTEEKAGNLIKEQCAACHKFQGKPETKFNLQGPDLMWGGDKYQRSWLLGWLTGKKENLYPNGYRWDRSRTPIKHMVLSDAEAEAVADYFEKHFRDPRIKKNAIDLSEFSKIEADFGAQIYRQYSCFGCHQIKEDGNKIGGPISTTLYGSGKRYNVDWLYRFALNPQDFTPHSGEYLADLSELGVRYIVGYLMTLGVDDYKYFEPWKTEYFQNASADRGAKVYSNYCAQCHGAEGKGDGPGAEGLDPKPAVHAQMALNEFPEDYLFNVVYYGGKSVGKHPNMPDWGLTLPPQDLADVIAYLRATFKGGGDASATGKLTAATGPCPQKRKTKKAPSKFLKMENPVQPSRANIEAGKSLFQKKAQPLACMQCHGNQGNGLGTMGAALTPKPRNFTCSATMNDIPDGQLFWIIKNGSPGTGMLAYQGLKDNEIWQLVHYIRTFSK